MSLMSSCSVDSDWSDEELEELEKIFGSIQHKSSLAENCNTAVPPERSVNSPKMWRQLRKSRRTAITKMKEAKRLGSNASTGSSSELERAIRPRLIECHGTKVT